MNQKPSMKPPFWLSGERIQSIRRTAERWWEVAEGYVRLPLQTFDVLSCDIGFVDLIGYQRGIDRFRGETERFYRLRVHHALRNARVAGTPKGMNQILQNLELPKARYQERLPQYDWDMTQVTFTGRDYAALHTEIDFALNYYWRTCRRFVIEQEISATNTLGVTHFASGHAATKPDDKSLNPIPFRPAQQSMGIGNTLSGHAQTKHSRLTHPVPFRTAQTPVWANSWLTGAGITSRTFAL